MRVDQLAYGETPLKPEFGYVVLDWTSLCGLLSIIKAFAYSFMTKTTTSDFKISRFDTLVKKSHGNYKDFVEKYQKSVKEAVTNSFLKTDLFYMQQNFSPVFLFYMDFSLRFVNSLFYHKL